MAFLLAVWCYIHTACPSTHSLHTMTIHFHSWIPFGSSPSDFVFYSWSWHCCTNVYLHMVINVLLLREQRPRNKPHTMGKLICFCNVWCVSEVSNTWYWYWGIDPGPVLVLGIGLGILAILVLGIVLSLLEVLVLVLVLGIDHGLLTELILVFKLFQIYQYLSGTDLIDKSS